VHTSGRNAETQLMAQTCVMGGPSQKFGFSELSDFRIVGKSLWTCVVYQTCSLPLTSTFFPIYYLLIVLPVCAVLSELVTAGCKSYIYICMYVLLKSSFQGNWYEANFITW